MYFMLACHIQSQLDTIDAGKLPGGSRSTK